MIYLIVRHSFDSWENHIDSAHLELIHGYVDDEVSAMKIVKEFNTSNQAYTFTGWDGNKYPYFNYVKLEKYEGVTYNGDN